MRRMTQGALDTTIRNHELWLLGMGGERANLDGSDLSGLTIRGSLRWARIAGTNLVGADMRMARLAGAILTGSDMSRAKLQGADLRGAQMEGAVLQSANLSRCVLRDAFLAGAYLNGAILPAPSVILLAHWGQLPRELTRRCMAYAAANHPDPTAFSRWAAGGPWPYDGVGIDPVVRFERVPELWSDELLPETHPVETALSLVRAIIVERS